MTTAMPDVPPTSRFNDSRVLIGRSTRHMLRSPDSLIMAVVLPVSILLVFVYVFGGAIQTGADYVDYVVPGIILITAAFGAALTATAVAADMNEGMVERLRTMPVRSWAVINGHVVASMIRNFGVTAVVFGVSFAIGFRPSADLVQWLGVIGVTSLFVLAITWLSVVLGLIARSVEAASGFTFFIVFVPYLSSAFVPTETMTPVLAAIAEHQPVTPIIETARGLLLDQPLGNEGLLSLLWCGVILAAMIPLSVVLFRRRTR